MKFSKNLVTKIFLILLANQFFLISNRVEAAEDIKIIYGVFSRTVTVDSLKNFAIDGTSSNKLRRILNATGSPDNEIQSVLNKDF